MNYRTQLKDKILQQGNGLSFSIKAGIYPSMLCRFLKGENIGIKYLEKIVNAAGYKIILVPLASAETPIESEGSPGAG